MSLTQDIQEVSEYVYVPVQVDMYKAINTVKE